MISATQSLSTSNVGTGGLSRLPWASGPVTVKNYEDMKDTILGELKYTLRPEFLNRIDEIIVFHALEEEHLSEIVNLMLAEVQGRLAEYGIGIKVTEKAKKLLAAEGYDPAYGARPLRRVIQQK